MGLGTYYNKKKGKKNVVLVRNINIVQVFDKYVRERADEERKEKKAKAKELKEVFKIFLEDLDLTSRSTFSDFSRLGKK